MKTGEFLAKMAKLVKMWRFMGNGGYFLAIEDLFLRFWVF
jgi:hypothetical protein